MHVRGIIFDFDGTIAETEQSGHRIAYNRAFEACGLNWHWDPSLYHQLLFVGGGKERLRYYVENVEPDGYEVAGPDLIDRIHEAKNRHFAQIAEQMPLRPGVGRLIREAKAAGIALAIATTASARGVKAVLSQEPDLRDAFEVYATGEVTERKKPAPDVYLWALDRLNLSAGECVAIEDSSIGLGASRAAKIPTLITVNDDTRMHDFSGASAVLSDLGEPGAPATCFEGIPPPDGVVDVHYLNTIITSGVAHRA